MKKNKYHIYYSRMLLICFLAGQCMIYAHTHAGSGVTSSYQPAKSSSHQTVQEKCYLCDVMHHNAMVVSTGVHLAASGAVLHLFNIVEYNFTSIRTAHTSSRAPPVFFS